MPNIFIQWESDEYFLQKLAEFTEGIEKKRKDKKIKWIQTPLPHGVFGFVGDIKGIPFVFYAIANIFNLKNILNLSAYYEEELNKMNLKPIIGNIIVKRDTREVTEGGIFIPDQFREKIGQGTVVAASEGSITKRGVFVEPDVKVGDHVVFGKYAGRELEVDKQKYLIMKFTDVIAVIEDVE